MWTVIWEKKTHLKTYAPDRDSNQSVHPHSQQRLLVRIKNYASTAIANALNADSDHTVRMRRLIWIFTGRICTTVPFLKLRLILPYCWGWTHCLLHNDIIKASCLDPAVPGYVSRPRWLSWVRVRLVIRRLRIQPPPGGQHSFWFKKGSCQLLAKQYAQYWLTA